MKKLIVNLFNTLFNALVSLSKVLTSFLNVLRSYKTWREIPDAKVRIKYSTALTLLFLLVALIMWFFVKPLALLILAGAVIYFIWIIHGTNIENDDLQDVLDCQANLGREGP